MYKFLSILIFFLFPFYATAQLSEEDKSLICDLYYGDAIELGRELGIEKAGSEEAFYKMYSDIVCDDNSTLIWMAISGAYIYNEQIDEEIKNLNKYVSLEDRRKILNTLSGAIPDFIPGDTVLGILERNIDSYSDANNIKTTLRAIDVHRMLVDAGATVKDYKTGKGRSYVNVDEILKRFDDTVTSESIDLEISGKRIIRTPNNDAVFILRGDYLFDDYGIVYKVDSQNRSPKKIIETRLTTYTKNGKEFSFEPEFDTDKEGNTIGVSSGRKVSIFNH